MSTVSSRLGPVGAQIQMSSPLGQAIQAISRQFSPDAPSGPHAGLKAKVLAIASQVPVSSPIGQWLLAWAIAIEAVDDSVIPEIVDKEKIAQGAQVGTSPLTQWGLPASQDNGAY